MDDNLRSVQQNLLDAGADPAPVVMLIVVVTAMILWAQRESRQALEQPRQAMEQSTPVMAKAARSMAESAQAMAESRLAMERSVCALGWSVETLDKVADQLGVLHTQTFVHSHIDADGIDLILWKLKLEWTRMQWTQQAPAIPGLEGFPWGPEEEDSYATEYCAFLSASVRRALATHGLAVARIEHRKYILSVRFKEHGVKLNGGADMLIVPTNDARLLFPGETWPKHARVVVEVKKTGQPL